MTHSYYTKVTLQRNNKICLSNILLRFYTQYHLTFMDCHSNLKQYLCIPYLLVNYIKNIIIVIR